MKKYRNNMGLLLCCSVCGYLWEGEIKFRFGRCPFCGETIDLYRAIAK